MEPQVPFEEFGRTRPLRTYSHKGRTTSSTVLPLLRTREPTASLVRKHQRGLGSQDKDSRHNGGIPKEETVTYQAEYDFGNEHELELGLCSYT